MVSRTELNPEMFDAQRLLLTPEYLIQSHESVSNHAVVIEDGYFSDVGPAENLLARYPDAVHIDLPGFALMPGFIDAHHHLTQSFGKALAFGEPSEIFKRVWVPLEGNLDSELMYLSGKLAALESLRGGFTTVVDAGVRTEGNLEPIAKAVTEAGIRCVLGMICTDKGEDPSSAQNKTLKQAENHLDEWANHNLIHPSLAISIPEAASDEMIYAVSNLCREADVVFQTHVNEHLASVERSLIQRGLRPLEHLHSIKALGPQTLVAHATLVTPKEISILQESGTAVAYNPVASQWKGNATAPALYMHEQGIRLGLGTDATRSDGFRLIDAAEATQRLSYGHQTGDFSSGGGWPWLDQATASGAEAISLGKLTGEIKKGKVADFLLVDVDTPEFQPSRDLVWELTRFGNRDQIVGVFIAGDLRLWEGWPVDWDGKALMREVSQRTSEAIEKAPIQKIHPHSNKHRILFEERKRD
ncbi:amidohydrolase family protein [Natribacillus halophilus]|uniref:Cytosine/adenosine deaminase n=1 Tax=Natribacillus halophilus TaxID=549003 RepID=A0A1G8MZJ9_9BACI|nr:amidohydrolase family protein [Natribacillus halophilus]SDI73368.1 Cytosine/adenosine deaminase [Natribacillus halophilus]